MSMRAFALLSTRTKATYLRSYGSTSLHRDHLCSGISLLPRFCSFSTSDVRRRCVSPRRHMPRMPICPLARDFCEISYWYTSNRYRPLPRSSRDAGKLPSSPVSSSSAFCQAWWKREQTRLRVRWNFFYFPWMASKAFFLRNVIVRVWEVEDFWRKTDLSITR